MIVVSSKHLMYACWVIVFACFLWHSDYPFQVCLAAESAISSEAIIAAMFSERERLVTGDFRIRGRESRSEFFDKGLNLPSKANSREIDERVTVDFRNELIRYEFAVTSLQPQAGLPEDAHHRVHVVGREKNFSKSVEETTIAIGAKAGIDFTWDVRTVGMQSFDDIEYKNCLENYIQTFQKHLQLMRIRTTPQEESGVLVMEMLFSLDPEKPDEIVGRRRIWINEKQGYSPFRMEEQRRVTDDMASDEYEWLEPYTTSSTEWKQVGDVWVPLTSTVTYAVDEPGVGGFRVQYDLSFDWISVNEEIDPTRFSLESLDIPPGSHYITDQTIQPGRSITVQHPSVPDAKRLRSFQGLSESETVPAMAFGTAEWSLSQRTMLILVNFVFVAVLVCVVVFRRISSTKRGSGHR